MNILNKLTLKNLALNKKRTIVTIIGIILSTSLICGTATIVTSVQRTLIENCIHDNGNFHAMFYNIPKDEQIYITNHKEVSQYMRMQNLGYAILENSKNEYKPYVYLKAYDDNAMKNMAVNLIEGRLPANDSEIIISEHIISNGKVQYKIGDKITLDISNRLSNGVKLFQNTMFLNDEEEHEYLEKIYTKEYTIVGIMERPNYDIEEYTSPGYTIITRHIR